MLTPEEIDKLAELSRLDISSEEKKGLLGDLEAILAYVSEVKEATKEKWAPGKGEMTNINLREDNAPHEPGAYTEEILAEVPDTADGYVKVKKIIGE